MWSERLRRLRHTITNQIDLKALAMILAVVIFFGVRGVISNTLVVNLPVELDVDDEELAILSLDPPTVRVTLRGALSELRQLVEDDMSVRIRPRSIDVTGETVETIQARQVRGRGGVRVVNIEPHRVHVAYDRQDSRLIPIADPVLLGQPVRGRAEVEYEPREVRVRGAVRHLDRFQDEHLQLQTEPIDLEGRMQSFTRQLRVLPPEEFWLAEIIPAEITARVSIVRETVTREFTAMPIVVMNHPDSYDRFELAPSNATVRIFGRQEVVQRLEPERLTVFVDGRSLVNADIQDLPLQLFVPPGLGIETSTVEPRSVRMRRRAEPARPVEEREHDG